MNRKNKLLILYCIMILVVILATLAIASRTSSSNLTYATYTVRPGDTIWGIAREYCPRGMDVREWIHEIRQINDSDCLIYPGQELQILKEME